MEWVFVAVRIKLAIVEHATIKASACKAVVAPVPSPLARVLMELIYVVLQGLAIVEHAIVKVIAQRLVAVLALSLKAQVLIQTLVAKCYAIIFVLLLKF